MSSYITSEEDLARIFDWAEKHERSDALAENYMHCTLAVYATDSRAIPENIALSALRVRDYFGKKILKHLGST